MVPPCIVAEAKNTYQTAIVKPEWVDVLVDCPGLQGLYTYRLAVGMSIEAGDILSVPFGTQTIGGIAIRFPLNPT